MAMGLKRLAILTQARHAATHHAALLANASALATGTLVTAVLGFAYWWVAARNFSPATVGFAAAAVSMMNLLGHIGEFGLGPFLIGRMSRAEDDTPTLISTALLAVSIACVVVGILYVAVDRVFDVGLGGILASGLNATVFVAGAALTGFTIVLDQAFIGLLRGSMQMWRNVAFSICKLGLLALVAWHFGQQANEEAIFTTWLVGQAASLAIVAAVAAWRRNAYWRRPQLDLLKPLVGEVLSHHFLNIVLQAPALALPFLVTVVLSPATNAAFYAAWSLVNVALLVPASLTTVLYSTGQREPEEIAVRLKLSLAISLAAGCCAGLGLLLFSPFVLRLFNPAYPEIAGTSLKLLGFGVVAVAIKYHYVALQRISGTMTRAAMLLCVGGIVELLGAAVGGRFGGLTGLTQGWLIAVSLEAALVLPWVICSARFTTAAGGPDVLSPPSGGLGVA